jgi:hypothetical protein
MPAASPKELGYDLTAAPLLIGVNAILAVGIRVKENFFVSLYPAPMPARPFI